MQVQSLPVPPIKYMNIIDYYIADTVVQLQILRTGLLIKAGHFAGVFDMYDFKLTVEKISSSLGIELVDHVQSGSIFKGYLYTNKAQMLKHSFLRGL